jgi:hypothetical protein
LTTEAIDNFNKFFLSTVSLYDRFLGSDRFKIGRTLFLYAVQAIKGFTEKFLKGGFEKGPNTYLFPTQSAIVSVIIVQIR